MTWKNWWVKKNHVKSTFRKALNSWRQNVESSTISVALELVIEKNHVKSTFREAWNSRRQNVKSTVSVDWEDWWAKKITRNKQLFGLYKGQINSDQKFMLATWIRPTKLKNRNKRWFLEIWICLVKPILVPTLTSQPKYLLKPVSMSLTNSILSPESEWNVSWNQWFGCPKVRVKNYV